MLRKAKYIWNQAPLFRLIWPFVGGIIIAVFLPVIEWSLIGLSLVVFTCVILAFASLSYRAVPSFLMILLFIIGYVHTSLLTERLSDNHYSNIDLLATKKLFLGEVVSNPIERTKSVKVELLLSGIADSGAIEHVDGRILVYLQYDSLAKDLRFGDVIMFNSRLNAISSPLNPSEFNYKRYMHFHQISHQAYIKSGEWRLMKNGGGIIRLAHQAQQNVIDVLQYYGVTDRELAIVAALLVGYKHHLTSDQVTAFASAGAMHVLAVSGLHVGIIFMILNLLFKPLLKVRYGKYLKAFLLLISLWGYAAVTGLSPSVTRACTMFSFVIVGQMINRHTNIFNTIATSAVFLLILNPFYIVEVGFQLSYLAVLGIVLLQPRIYELWKPKYWLVEKIWAITAVSMAAQLATFPLGLLYFHQFPNYFLLSNLVVIPAATVILCVGIALVTIQWIPLLSSWLGYLLYLLVHGLDRFISWVEGLPMALIQGIDIGIWETYLIYLLLISLSLFIITKRFKWLPATLLLLCVIQLNNIFEMMGQRTQSKMIIYSVRGDEAIDFIVGNDHVFLADSSLRNDFEKMRFHIHHNWWQHDLNEPIASLPELIQTNDLMEFRDQRLLILNDSNRVLNSIEVDHLFVQARTLQHPKEVLDKVEASVVLLSQNLDWKTRSYWETLLEEKGIDYWNMREDGAYVVEY
ncbi:ComEC family competence protein [Salibacteraceae bacterium]|nr:ComEC family competence protein [Salibacteraceae bacterium]